MKLLNAMRRYGATLGVMLLLGCRQAAPITETKVEARQNGGETENVPTFQFDPTWPKQPFPDNWILGNVIGVSVDSRDHIWIAHRSHTLLRNNEDGASQNPPLSSCCKHAPPVIEFDQEGNVVQAWGGPGPGYHWPEHSEPAATAYNGVHDVYVDYKDNVWIGNSGDKNYAHILKFTRDGKFLLQVGRYGEGKGSNDTTAMGKSTGVVVSPKTNEAFVSDGYVNRRVIVFDADTGAYKRHWGAYGNRPDDSAPREQCKPGAKPSQQFSTPHGIDLSRDGLLYVADRNNCRVQVFRTDGTFVLEGIVAPWAVNGSAFDVAVSSDPQQRYLYVVDGRDQKVWILRRSDLKVLGDFGYGGHFAGGLITPHNIAVDSKGNIYVSETTEGKRVQRFKYLGNS